MLNVAIIGCPKADDPGWIVVDTDQIQNRTGTFQDIGPAKILGFVFCGGCPGKSAVLRARMMARAGADIIALSSGLCKVGDNEFPCPYRAQMERQLQQHLTSVVVLGCPATV